MALCHPEIEVAKGMCKLDHTSLMIGSTSVQFPELLLTDAGADLMGWVHDLALTIVTNSSSLDSMQPTRPSAEATGVRNARDLEKSATVSHLAKSGEGEVMGEPEPPYSIFSAGEKRFITFITSLTSLFSPLTASTYHPVITTLASDSNVSIRAINLPITTYLVWDHETV
jgi:hypothetical protein